MRIKKNFLWLGILAICLTGCGKKESSSKDNVETEVADIVSNNVSTEKENDNYGQGSVKIKMPETEVMTEYPHLKSASQTMICDDGKVSFDIYIPDGMNTDEFFIDNSGDMDYICDYGDEKQTYFHYEVGIDKQKVDDWMRFFGVQEGENVPLASETEYGLISRSDVKEEKIGDYVVHSMVFNYGVGDKPSVMLSLTGTELKNGHLFYAEYFNHFDSDYEVGEDWYRTVYETMNEKVDTFDSETETETETDL